MLKLQKILLAEDSPELREIYDTFLSANGYTVACAKDGDEALELAAHFKPDLAFLDIMMPKRDGLEVLELLRHRPEYQCTTAKLVMMTSLSDNGQLSRQIYDDMDGYIVKSDIELPQLLDAIRSLQETTGQWRDHLVANRPQMA